MAEFVKVATIGEVPPGKILEVKYNWEPVALANVAGEYLAIGGVCTHLEGSLGDGELDGDTVVCPLHGGAFSLRTGEATEAPAIDSVPTYRVRVQGADIEIAPN